MSSTLCWRPPDPQGAVLETEDDRFKLILRDKFGMGEDISCGEVSIPWLQGMADAGVSGPGEVIDLIRKHGSVILREES